MGKSYNIHTFVSLSLINNKKIPINELIEIMIRNAGQTDQLKKIDSCISRTIL